MPELNMLTNQLLVFDTLMLVITIVKGIVAL